MATRARRPRSPTEPASVLEAANERARREHQGHAPLRTRASSPSLGIADEVDDLKALALGDPLAKVRVGQSGRAWRVDLELFKGLSGRQDWGRGARARGRGGRGVMLAAWRWARVKSLGGRWGRVKRRRGVDVGRVEGRGGGFSFWRASPRVRPVGRDANVGCDANVGAWRRTDLLSWRSRWGGWGSCCRQRCCGGRDDAGGGSPSGYRP